MIFLGYESIKDWLNGHIAENASRAESGEYSQDQAVNLTRSAFVVAFAQMLEDEQFLSKESADVIHELINKDMSSYMKRCHTEQQARAN